MKRETVLPPCAAQMGCLCAGHARGNSPLAECDTRETGDLARLKPKTRVRLSGALASIVAGRWVRTVRPTGMASIVAGGGRHRRPTQPRYVAMCIPGHKDDGSDDWWCVYDMKRRRTRKVIGTGPLHDEAAREAFSANANRRRR